jgi:hypothetical protein
VAAGSASTASAGPAPVRFTLPASATVSRVSLLQSGTDVPFERQGDAVTFTVPKVVDYEVAAIIQSPGTGDPTFVSPRCGPHRQH